MRDRVLACPGCPFCVPWAVPSPRTLRWRRERPACRARGPARTHSGSWTGCPGMSVSPSWGSTRRRWKMPVIWPAGSNCGAFCGCGDSMPTLPGSLATGRRWMLLAGRSARACRWRRLSVRTARPRDLAAVAGAGASLTWATSVLSSSSPMRRRDWFVVITWYGPVSDYHIAAVGELALRWRRDPGSAARPPARQRSLCFMPGCGDLGRWSGNHLREPPCALSPAPWAVPGFWQRSRSASGPATLGYVRMRCSAAGAARGWMRRWPRRNGGS